MRMLHDELRKGREAAGLSQSELADRAGIPRNQVARAERGDNITLDTLRKIVIHLPIESLTLLDKVSLTLDFYPQPEKVLYHSILTVQHLAMTMAVALKSVEVAQAALGEARVAEPMPGDEDEPLAKIDPTLLLRRLEKIAKTLEAFPANEAATEPATGTTGEMA